MKNKRLVQLGFALNILLLGGAVYLWLNERKLNATLSAAIVEQGDAAWKMELVEAQHASEEIAQLKAANDRDALWALRRHLQGKVAALDHFQSKMSPEQKASLENLRALASEQ